MVGGSPLEEVSEFTYLGSIIDHKLDEEQEQM